jgi:hypothetical protein
MSMEIRAIFQRQFYPIVYQTINIVELFRLSSFHERDTKLDRSLSKNQYTERK